MKHTKLYFLGLLPFVLEGCNSTTAEKIPDLPNVIYVFPDQMRNHAMEFWNEPEYREYINFKADPVHTPNLSRFAKESVVLTSAMSNCPLSSPHRGSLLTGMYPENSGVPLNCNSNRPISSLREEAVCVSDVYKQAGYNCAYIGKLHVDYPTPNDPQRPGQYVEDLQTVWDTYTPPERRHGFDYWYSYGTFDVHKQPHYWDTNGNRHEIREWSPAHETDKAIAYLRNEGDVRNKEKPFFMMISYNPPHSPYQSLDDCMEEDYDLYKDIPLGELLIRPNADTTMQKAPSVRYYFASVTGVDREFGRLLKELEKLGLDKNTIVVFTSDHGETMCSHGINDPKNSPYAESMNVPFLVRYPGKIIPRVDSELLLSTPDIMPTLLGLSGLDGYIPETVEGRNYASWFTNQDKTIPLRGAALYIRNTDGMKDADGKVVSYFPVSRGIKTKEYTLSLTINKETRDLDNVLLFNDREDPYQMNNMSVEDNKEIVYALCKEMALLLKEADDPWYKEGILKEMIPYE
ncbi:MAG: sulfatase [Tannerella sp.]|jgi:arylsulfatase A-like enzyme|nr:sulfatase [Tannerella sp.]